MVPVTCEAGVAWGLLLVCEGTEGIEKKPQGTNCAECEPLLLPIQPSPCPALQDLGCSSLCLPGTAV